jgi:hypothetical protein
MILAESKVSHYHHTSEQINNLFEKINCLIAPALPAHLSDLAT